METETEENPKTKPVVNIPPIAINKRYTIYPSDQKPDFHSNPALAYKIIDGDNPEEEMHGLICDPKLHPRLSTLEILNLLAKTNKNVISPVGWSIVYWEEEGRECPVLIMKDARMMPFDIKNPPNPFTDEVIVNVFMRHAIELLMTFEDKGLTHRAINLDNLYYFNELKRRIILGECISSPPGITQGALFDTIDAGLSVPLGKGDSYIGDDIYALGMVVLCMLNGRNLGAGMSNEEIVSRKMLYGSFEAFHNPKVRLSGTMESCMQSMLDDNRTTRASTTDLMTWLNGQNMRIESERPAKRSTKPMIINGKNYFTSKDLAKGMGNNWEISTKKVVTEDFADWIRNNLSETMVTLNFEMAISPFEHYNAENRHRVLARILLALHAYGPIRFRAFSATIDGVSRLISHFVHNNEAREIFRQLMGSGVIHFWDQIRRKDEKATEDKNVLRYNSYIEELRKDSPIEGLNTLVYTFNPDLPCQSKRFERYFVYQPKHLLPAIERILEEDTEFDSLIDYHMICFLKMRYDRSIAKEIRTYMISSVKEESVVAEAELLSKIQNEYYPSRQFIRICAKLCELLEPAVKRHHSRSMRREIREEMKMQAEKGHIRRLVQLVSDKGMIEDDKVNFNLSRAEYSTLLQEISFIDFNLKNIESMVSKVGGDISASVSGILASLITLGYVSYWSLFS